MTAGVVATAVTIPLELTDAFVESELVQAGTRPLLGWLRVVFSVAPIATTFPTLSVHSVGTTVMDPVTLPSTDTGTESDAVPDVPTMYVDPTATPVMTASWGAVGATDATPEFLLVSETVTCRTFP